MNSKFDYLVAGATLLVMGLAVLYISNPLGLLTVIFIAGFIGWSLIDKEN